jgi:TRAP-type C4-dicarboxylate transport system permease large subunit
MRIVNFILAVLFLVFAFVQLNDPDPAVWIIIYGVMATVSIMAMFEYYNRRMLIILLVIYASYSTVYIPGMITWASQDHKAELFDNIAKMNHYYIEEAREFLGLLICVIVLAWYVIRSGRLAKTAKK